MALPWLKRFWARTVSAPSPVEKIFPPVGGPPTCLLVTLCLVWFGSAGAPCLAVRFLARGPMPSYSGAADQPTFSLLSRAFAFRQGARFTGLLDPAFFRKVAAKHQVHFGAGADDTFSPEV